MWFNRIKILLTDSFISRVEQFGERGGGTFVLDQGGALLVGRKLAKNSGSNSLNVLDFIVKELKINGRMT